MSWWTIIGDISNVIATALAAFSIYITVKEQKASRKNDIVKTKAEQDLNWYNTVVLEDIVRSLTIFIDESEQAVDRCKKVENADILEHELKVIYHDIKENFKSLATRVQLLKIFSQSLYRKCNESLQKILDLYSEIINEALSKKHLHNKRERDIQDERIKMIKELYLFKETFIGKDE